MIELFAHVTSPSKPCLTAIAKLSPRHSLTQLAELNLNLYIQDQPFNSSKIAGNKQNLLSTRSIEALLLWHYFFLSLRSQTNKLSLHKIEFIAIIFSIIDFRSSKWTPI